MSHLIIQDLHKSFGELRALQGVDMVVEKGEFFALLGPSAAGKTTTLRTICGIEKADQGRILFDGDDVTGAQVRGRDMAMVFQTFALYPHLSIFDNLAYPLRQAGMNKQEAGQRVGEVAEMLRLSHTLERKPGTASGGEQQRVAIGRALVRRPSLLLLDEPLTNLDAKLRFDTRAEFKRLHRELGMTIVYATADELEALSMGQRIALLSDGRVVQTGTPDELYTQPQDTYVAGMVSSMQINAFIWQHGGSIWDEANQPKAQAIGVVNSDASVKGFQHHLDLLKLSPPVTTRMLPPIIVIIPIFLMFRLTGLSGSYIGVILLYAAFNLPFSIWMIKSFFDELSADVEDAARLDGSSERGVFFRICLPQLKAGLAATAVFALILTWNEFLFALLLTGSDTRTVPVAMARTIGGELGVDWGLLAAIITLFLIPVFAVTYLLQNHLLRGVTFGTIKK
ncbi:MAG: ATP-binding cassette domain-containing protein [Alphaproteobacteria bacterium]|jgi:ABC-type sugar transport system ATPase subunit|nr:ATP-binding cassette domain-containing protein [Alphaproteobacteria bacterium]